MAYDGGKAGAGVYQQIINQIPPHTVYIEAFAGDASIARYKRPAQHTILIEADERQAGQLTQAALPGCIVICGDALEELKRYKWRGHEFLYCDPPYLFASRSNQRNLYRCEFGEIEQHRALIRLLRRLPCQIALSGYWSPLYELELSDWRAIQFTTIKRSGERATEWLWMNYAEPLELHDYRYLGQGFRQRERIKRKKQRWVERLRSLPQLERHALMAALDELRQEAVEHRQK